MQMTHPVWDMGIGEHTDDKRIMVG
jgi:hypothetical protein